MPSYTQVTQCSECLARWASILNIYPASYFHATALISNFVHCNELIGKLVLSRTCTRTYASVFLKYIFMDNKWDELWHRAANFIVLAAISCGI